MPILTDMQKLEPGAKIILYELDMTEIGGGTLLFHGYPQSGPIVWQANTYSPWSIQAEGFAKTGEGQQPNPTLRVGNIGQSEDGETIAGVISSLCIYLDDLVGAKLIRHITLAHYLDAVNFPDGINPTADPTQEFVPDIWIVEQKTAETSAIVEFMLSSVLDFNNQQLPARQIIGSVCQWIRTGGYRGPYCQYTGDAMFDLDDNPVTDPSQDKCAGYVNSCKIRFGEFEVINFGGFPAAGLVR